MMGFLGILADKEKEMRAAMRRLNIREKDIVETFVRSSGPGGQNVNKVSTCVLLRHIPTGIQVKSKRARSQNDNRYRAYWILVHKIEQKQQAVRAKALCEGEKLKRQNRKKPMALKEKILQGKKIQSQRKLGRQKIRWDKTSTLLD